jgi:hypothetical protein
VSLLSYSYTATAGQTTFSGADDNAATLSYVQQNLIVTLNGIVLEDGTDYTATNGTSIVLTTGAAAGDELNVIAFKSFTVADMVPASTGGTFSGNVAVNGNLTVDTNTLFVDAANNWVGVGTSSPNLNTIGTVLHVNNGNVANAALTRYTTGDTGSAATDGFDVGMWSDGDAFVWMRESANMRFATAGTERMRITSTGSVGIGTTNPGASLDVIGGIRARGGAPGSAGVNNNGYAFTSPGDADSGMFSSADGQIEFYSNNVEAARFNNWGDLRIGTTAFGGSGDSRLVVAGTSAGSWSNRILTLELSGNNGPGIGFHDIPAASAGILKFWGPASQFEFRNFTDTGFLGINASAFVVSSDYRLKENIVPLVGACDRLKQIPVHRFNFKPFEETGVEFHDMTVDGFLAHEVQPFVPEAITGEKDAVDDEGNSVYQGIDQSKLVPLLTAALQEALARIETLEADVAALKGEPA